MKADLLSGRNQTQHKAEPKAYALVTVLYVVGLGKGMEGNGSYIICISFSSLSAEVVPAGEQG